MDNLGSVQFLSALAEDAKRTETLQALPADNSDLLLAPEHPVLTDGQHTGNCFVSTLPARIAVPV